MFILDSLMIAGLRWTLETVVTAADAEMNDDSALREQLLEAEVRREAGDITDAEYARTEGDLLARIREIRERREGGSGPLAFGTSGPDDTGERSRLEIDASVTGDFHAPASDPAPTMTVKGRGDRPAATTRRRARRVPRSRTRT